MCLFSLGAVCSVCQLPLALKPEASAGPVGVRSRRSDYGTERSSKRRKRRDGSKVYAPGDPAEKKAGIALQEGPCDLSLIFVVCGGWESVNL